MANARLCIVNGALGKTGVGVISAVAKDNARGTLARIPNAAGRLVIQVLAQSSESVHETVIRLDIVLGRRGLLLENARQHVAWPSKVGRVFSSPSTTQRNCQKLTLRTAAIAIEQ